jgi:hypothetical protein
MVQLAFQTGQLDSTLNHISIQIWGASKTTESKDFVHDRIIKMYHSFDSFYTVIVAQLNKQLLLN